MAERDRVEALAEIEANVSEEFVDVHKDLDGVEKQLRKLQKRQMAMRGEVPKQSRKGQVTQIDLRTLIELDEVDDDFERRFEAFASADTGQPEQTRHDWPKR